MKIFFEYWGILFYLVIILIHVGKVVYILFKPKFLEKYKIFTNKNLSDFKLVLYYLLLIGTTIYLVIQLIDQVQSH